MHADELAKRCAAAMYERDQASPALGIEIENVTPGHAVLTMKVEDWMANGAGVCHGGLIFSLADTAMAFASNSYNDQMVAMNASIEFIAAGTIGERLSAKATEVHRAGRTATYRVAVEDGSGQLVAQFLGRTYRIRGQQIELSEAGDETKEES